MSDYIRILNRYIILSGINVNKTKFMKHLMGENKNWWIMILLDIYQLSWAKTAETRKAAAAKSFFCSVWCEHWGYTHTHAHTGNDGEPQHSSLLPKQQITLQEVREEEAG